MTAKTALPNLKPSDFHHCEPYRQERRTFCPSLPAYLPSAYGVSWPSCLEEVGSDLVHFLDIGETSYPAMEVATSR